jgi:hypothetical protein
MEALMESARTWLQDWSDACEYAKECWPDLSFATHSEPWAAFVAIGALCCFLWLLSESGLQRLLLNERRHAEAQNAVRSFGEAGAARDAFASGPAVDRRAAA